LAREQSERPCAPLSGRFSGYAKTLLPSLVFPPSHFHANALWILWDAFCSSFWIFLFGKTAQGTSLVAPAPFDCAGYARNEETHPFKRGRLRGPRLDRVRRN
jgi:hypothetical protein